MQQARPGAALEKRIGARAQQKSPLQRVDGAVDGPDRSERPVIVSRPRPRPAVLEDLRSPVIRRDHDVGKRFVVAQHHVEAWPQPLDQVGLKQQCLGLGAGNDKFERAGRRDHALDAGVEAGRTRIGADAVTDVFSLADIEHVAACIDHAVDAWPGRREFGVTEDGVAASGQRIIGPRALISRIEFIRQRKGRLFFRFGALDFRFDVFFRNAHSFDGSKYQDAADDRCRRIGRCCVELGSMCSRRRAAVGRSAAQQT